MSARAGDNPDDFGVQVMHDLISGVRDAFDREPEAPQTAEHMLAVQKVEGLDFKGAVGWLGGVIPLPVGDGSYTPVYRLRRHIDREAQRFDSLFVSNNRDPLGHD